MFAACLLAAMAIVAARTAAEAKQAGGAAPAAAPQAGQPAPNPAITPPALKDPMPQEDTPNAADQAPGHEVRISLTDNFLADRLPFDVPFNLAGSVETTVKRMDLYVYQLRSNADLSRVITALRATPDCVTPRPAGARQVSRSTAATGTNGAFKLFVNALPPNYYYALCLLGVTPVPLTEIETDVRRALADTLPRLDTGGDVSLPLLTAVRAAMADRLTQIGQSRERPASIPQGNLFHQNTQPTTEFRRLFSQQFVRDYGNLAIQQRNFQQTLQALATALDAARTAGVPITTALAEALSPAKLALPPRERAILENKATDRTEIGIPAARQLLDAAIQAPGQTNAQRDALQAVSAQILELDDTATNYVRLFNDLRGATNEAMRYVALEAQTVYVTMGSSVLGADLVRSAYVSLDAGIAYSWRLENLVFYAGSNIYLRPINKEAPLRYAGTFLHRFALTVGITTTVEDKSRRAEDLRPVAQDQQTSNSLLLGAGLRITPSLRVGAGALVFKETDPNPLLDHKSVTATPYVSFTADINVGQVFRSLF
jgi:hypothetical protein